MVQAGVRDIKDLQILTPGLTVTSSTSEASTTARIRGIGTVGDNPGLESSVGVVIDGVYRPRNGVGFNDLGDLDRIEVLKGPQGTLFGKSTSAGVINILTAEPSFKPGYDAEATVGNYEAWGVNGSVTGPLVADQLAGRLYVGGHGHEGYDSVVTGAGPSTDRRDNDQNAWNARGQLLYTPNDQLRVRLIADYSDQRQHCCDGGAKSGGDLARLARGPPDPGAAQRREPVARSIRPGDLRQPRRPEPHHRRRDFRPGGRQAGLGRLHLHHRLARLEFQARSRLGLQRGRPALQPRRPIYRPVRHHHRRDAPGGQDGIASPGWAACSWPRRPIPARRPTCTARTTIPSSPARVAGGALGPDRPYAEQHLHARLRPDATASNRPTPRSPCSPTTRWP